jgi:type IV fimbrial biogenesis protein FimT
MHKSRGFTLLEVMVVLSIIAVLTTLAAPSFVQLIRSNSMSSSVNAFMADMRFARSESIRRGGAIVLCRSDNPEGASPVCGSGSEWVGGWIIFHDLDNSGDRNTGDVVIRVQAPITTMDSIIASGTSSLTTFRFSATGRLQGQSSSTQLSFGGSSFDNSQKRVVCVNLSGRVRIAGDGTTSCSTDR